MFAICKAIQEATKCFVTAGEPQIGLLRICSDCESALDLASGDSHTEQDDLINLVKAIDVQCNNVPFDIEFQWVRSHSNHEYNDLADTLAYSHAQGYPYG